MRTWSFIFTSRSLARVSMSIAGTVTRNSRFRPSVVVSVTCIELLAKWLIGWSFGFGLGN
jgi:hypothetical protein